MLLNYVIGELQVKVGFFFFLILEIKTHPYTLQIPNALAMEMVMGKEIPSASK